MATAAILDLVQRLKLIVNTSLASMRRPAKFARNRSSRTGDINDFSNSKMAAVPPLLDPVQRLKLIGNISIGPFQRPAKFGRKRSSRAGDIIVLVRPSSKFKTPREHIIASVRRPEKFGRNRSSRSGDIKDFSKSKMAAMPPFWI